MARGYICTDPDLIRLSGPGLFQWHKLAVDKSAYCPGTVFIDSLQQAAIAGYPAEMWVGFSVEDRLQACASAWLSNGREDLRQLWGRTGGKQPVDLVALQHAIDGAAEMSPKFDLGVDGTMQNLGDFTALYEKVIGD